MIDGCGRAGGAALGSVQRAHAMSAPQHIGDLIFPWSFGHFETWTVDPSSLARLASTRGASQVPQVAFTDMPHEVQVYVAMGFLPQD